MHIFRRLFICNPKFIIFITQQVRLFCKEEVIIMFDIRFISLNQFYCYPLQISTRI